MSHSPTQDSFTAEMADHGRLGGEAARLIWADHPDASAIRDPLSTAFASGLLSGLADEVRAAPGVIKKVVGHAAAAAEDLNVDPFQGLVEVLQNADDLGATMVRFGLAGPADARRLLVVHDGARVTCHHVLAMTLPYLTTKTGDARQKGRFGIGLKTLRRIASRVAVHSAPYHFAAEGLLVHAVPPVAAVPGLYDPARHTLFELDLLPGFEVRELDAWFDRFDEENLLFLESVVRFARVDLDMGRERAFALSPGPWRRLGPGVPDGEARTVRGTNGGWEAFRVRVPRPEGIDRSLKATGEHVTISVSLPDHEHAAGLFIGFRTRIPVVLPFSIDAQFDPSTAREGLIENSWNKWLVARLGETLAALALHALAADPAAGWSLVVAPEERVGLPEETWPCGAFASAFEAARAALAADATVGLDGREVPIGRLCYEAALFEGFLDGTDLAALRPDAIPLPGNARDLHGRWRRILRQLAPGGEVGAGELAGGFGAGLFHGRPPSWWVVAADRLTAGAPDVVPGTPCWLSDLGSPVATHAKGATARPVVVGDPLSAFAEGWKLFDRLHDAYGENPAGRRATAWLQANAAVTSLVDAADELAAFAEAYAEAPVEVNDEELRTLRDRFDMLTDRRAEPLGARVGAALRLGGFVWRGGRKVEIKVAPTEAYLPKSLDGEHAYWPEAAGDMPEIPWLAPSYDDRLRTGATRTSRKRTDGTISRGARKFLLLLGAACSPRIASVERRRGGGPTRTRELQALGAEYVDEDRVSPHLERILAALRRMPKKERRARSAALIKALSRYWEVYEPHARTTAYHMATKYEYAKGMVDSDWLCRLRETDWVAVGTGDLVRPELAVVRTPQTQTLYDARSFVAGISPEDLRGGFTKTLCLITDVRASDLVSSIEAMRTGVAPVDGERTVQAYRALAKMCPSSTTWNTKVGDLSLQELRRRFAAGNGLILLDAARGRWRRPDQLFVGRDIFHDPERFVPGGQVCLPLWTALGIGRPGLDDCIPFLRGLGTRAYGVEVEAILIDVYRHIEPLIPKIEPRQRKALRTVPVGTSAGWRSARPVFHLADRELRERLAEARPNLRFWSPPCDVHALPNLTAALGLSVVDPALVVSLDGGARVLGAEHALRFRACVDHLSNELARNDPAARDQMRVRWEELRDLPLAVHASPFEVSVVDERLSPVPIRVHMDAVLRLDPPLLTVTDGAFPRRDRCGRAVASLFPPDVRHRIEAEWVASWVASADAPIELMRMASDEEHQRATAERAAAASASIGAKVRVTPPASRSPTAAAPRRLKAGHGSVASVTVVPGSAPNPPQPTRPLISGPPPARSAAAQANSPGPLEYDNRDLEQRGWEILRDVLEASNAGELVDFRNRRQVGADGVIDWKTFVELKATGGGPQSSVELPAAEYERALERGLDFILALVSGLEEGQTTEVRLILDPLNRVAVRPVGSARLVGLGDAPAIVLRLDD